jgi:hypothetical protein
MAKDLFWTTMTFIILLNVLALAIWPTNKAQIAVMYNCSIAEISPDYPVAVKEECRKRNIK